MFPFRIRLLGGTGDCARYIGQDFGFCEAATVKIGIAAPIDLRLLGDLFPTVEAPNTYRFPLTAHLARALHSRGHEIVLFTLSRDVTKAHRIDGERITVYVCPARRHVGRW